MSASRQALFWVLGLVAFGLLIRLFSPVLLPFVAGFAIAYFFDPVVDKLGTMRLNRTWATSLVLLLFFLFFVLAVFLLAPVLQQQVAEFSAKLPKLLDVAQARLTALITRLSMKKWLARCRPISLVRSTLLPPSGLSAILI